jgi:hypothetical protein
MNFRILLIISLLITLPTVAFSNTLEVTKDCDQSDNTVFVINDIFELSDPDTIFLHRWANMLHIKTKPITLENESAFFMKKCDVSTADLDELERHLRQRKYIREAKVTVDENKKVQVTSFDNWSLMPTLDFSRKGGINKYSIGIKDRNLFGLGVDAEIEYFSDAQRTGYKFDTHFPLYLKQNISASIKLTKNDDGDSNAIFLEKPFVSFDTPYAYRLGFDNFNQIDTQFQNGLDIAKYNHDKSMTTGRWQWLSIDTNTETIRYGLGYTEEKHIFSDLVAPTSHTQTSLDPGSSYLPVDREHNYPFVTFDFLQKDYRKFTNSQILILSIKLKISIWVGTLVHS